MSSKSGIGKMVAVVLAIVIIVVVIAAAYAAITFSPSSSPSPTPTPTPAPTATPTSTPTSTPTPTATPKPTTKPTAAPTPNPTINPTPAPTPTPTGTGLTPTITLSRNGTTVRAGDTLRFTGTFTDPNTGATLPLNGNVGLYYTVTDSSGEVVEDTQASVVVNGAYSDYYGIGEYYRYTFQLRWNGDATTNQAQSNTITVTVFGVPPPVGG